MWRTQLWHNHSLWTHVAAGKLGGILWCWGQAWWPSCVVGSSPGRGSLCPPDPAAAVRDRLWNGDPPRLSGKKDAQSSGEENASCHGNGVWKHHQNVSNEGN